MSNVTIANLVRKRIPQAGEFYDDRQANVRPVSTRSECPVLLQGLYNPTPEPDRSSGGTAVGGIDRVTALGINTPLFRHVYIWIVRMGKCFIRVYLRRISVKQKSFDIVKQAYSI